MTERKGAYVPVRSGPPPIRRSLRDADLSDLDWVKIAIALFGSPAKCNQLMRADRR